MHNRLLADWIEDYNKNIFYTKAINSLYFAIQSNDFVTIIGPRGCGKSTAMHYVAIRMMKKDDFEILPCTEPADILTYLNINRNQIFIFDDVCETFFQAIFFITEWNRNANRIEKINQSTDSKEKRKILLAWDVIPFKTVRRRMQGAAYVFDMLSEENRLNQSDAMNIGDKYEVEPNIQNNTWNKFTFYPEFCKQYHSCKTKTQSDIVDILTCKIIDDFLEVLTDDNEDLLAALSLFVINGIDITRGDEFTPIDLKVNLFSPEGMSIQVNEQTLESLIGSYITKDLDHYTVINIDIYKGLVSFFVKHHFDFILKNSQPECLRTRFQFADTVDTVDSLKIILPSQREDAYFFRLYQHCISDNDKGVFAAFANEQLKNDKYRKKFISYFLGNEIRKQMLGYQLETLSVKLCSPLVSLLENGYIDIFKALVKENIKMPVLYIKQQEPLVWAAANEEHNIEEYLLKNNCDTNLCCTDIV